MLTIKSDDVYGRAKAYESIIKGTEIQGPKVPESFNVLVKELQGLGLKVDLQTENHEVIDAETVLAENIKIEASNTPTVSDIPVLSPAGSTTTDITTDDLTENFAGLTEEEGPTSEDDIELAAEETINVNDKELEEEA
jgi:hypothetical protein